MTAIAHHAMLMGAAGFTATYTNRIALPLTYDELDYNGLATWTRSGSGGPLVTPAGARFNGYDAKYKTTTSMPWLFSSTADLLLHASIKPLMPVVAAGAGAGAAGLLGDIVVHVGTDTASETSKLGYRIDDDSAISVPLVSLAAGATGYPLARYGWKYEHRFPVLTVGGYEARPQGILFIDANTYLLTAHYEDTLSRCYKLDINSGNVLGYFDFPSPHLHVNSAAWREDGTLWFNANGMLLQIDLDNSLATGTADILLTYDMQLTAVGAGEGLANIEWGRLGASNNEYLVASQYKTGGTPYLYLIPAAEVVDSGVFDVADRYKRFVCSIRMQGAAFYNGLLWTAQNKLTADAGTNLGKVQSIDLDAQADSLADGGTLVASSTHYAPGGMVEDLDFHPTTGWCWMCTEGWLNDGDYDGFLGVWSGPLDGTPVENHYTAHYDHSAGTVEVRINNREFGTYSYTSATTPACVTIGGHPTAAAGTATEYATCVVRNVVIDDSPSMWSDDSYLTVINGLYEPSTLTVHTISLTNPGAETGDSTGWTNETGSLDVRTAAPPPYAGTYSFGGGNNANTKARQRTVITSGTSLTTGQIDAGTLWARITWRQSCFSASSDADNGACGIRFLNATPTQLSESVAAKVRTAPDYTTDLQRTWVERSHAVAVPTGSRNIDALMDMTRVNGTHLDVYIDNIELVIYQP